MRKEVTFTPGTIPAPAPAFIGSNGLGFLACPERNSLGHKRYSVLHVATGKPIGWVFSSSANAKQFIRLIAIFLPQINWKLENLDQLLQELKPVTTDLGKKLCVDYGIINMA